MSIERFGGIYTPTCDVCGEELDGEFDFDDAVNAKKLAGWKSQKTLGYWADVCPACQRTAAEADFDD